MVVVGGRVVVLLLVLLLETSSSARAVEGERLKHNIPGTYGFMPSPGVVFTNRFPVSPTPLLHPLTL